MAVQKDPYTNAPIVWDDPVTHMPMPPVPPKWGLGPVRSYSNVPYVAPRSALALEQRLRSEARKDLKPNIEHIFNLEQNPNRR